MLPFLTFCEFIRLKKLRDFVECSKLAALKCQDGIEKQIPPEPNWHQHHNISKAPRPHSLKTEKTQACSTSGDASVTDLKAGVFQNLSAAHYLIHITHQQKKKKKKSNHF